MNLSNFIDKFHVHCKQGFCKDLLPVHPRETCAHNFRVYKEVSSFTVQT